MESAVWSPDLVEELLFRQFVKHEDVSQALPDPPKASSEAYLNRYEQATRMLFSYVRNGPVTALASQNVNAPTVGVKHYSSTPLKSFRSANAKAMEPPATRPQPRTPTPKATSRAPSVSKAGGASPVPPRGKRARVEWPSDVPTNTDLTGTSRSKMAPLTSRRIQAQQGVDPDILFAQNSGELPLHTIFRNYPKALSSLAAQRNASGDWREDTFSQEEEQLYKREMLFKAFGPSQCMYGKPTANS